MHKIDDFVRNRAAKNQHNIVRKKAKATETSQKKIEGNRGMGFRRNEEETSI
jgi:hypothetical protein